MEVDVYTKEGKPSGKKAMLSPSVFGIEPNQHAMYEAVTTYLANQRQGTHKTKTYGEVSGSGKKLWKQKHTGRARIGAIRSPLWKGGGAIFGPVPRDYSRKLPKQVARLARRSALSHKLREEAIRIVEDFTLELPRTKDMAAVLAALQLGGRKTLLVTTKNDPVLWKAGRNIPNLAIIEASKASTYDILNNQMLLVQQSAVAEIEKSLP
ncbi:MAG TPA: 50S ribosomal protein L4 [Bacteroidota bacterium]|nr:50S ribosomal protein L4 [Bacteroidota bacterium]